MQIQQEDASEQRVNNSLEVLLMTWDLSFLNSKQQVGFTFRGHQGLSPSCVWQGHTSHRVHVGRSCEKPRAQRRTKTAGKPNASVLSELMLTSKVQIDGWALLDLQKQYSEFTEGHGWRSKDLVTLWTTVLVRKTTSFLLCRASSNEPSHTPLHSLNDTNVTDSRFSC